jgi:hypothetical protein
MDADNLELQPKYFNKIDGGIIKKVPSSSSLDLDQELKKLDLENGGLLSDKPIVKNKDLITGSTITVKRNST